MINKETPVKAALTDASGLASRPSISQPQNGLDSNAGTEVIVIINAAVDRVYPASVINGTVCSNMTCMVMPNKPKARTRK